MTGKDMFIIKRNRDNYLYFLYLFPQKQFFKKLAEIEGSIGLTLWEVIEDELYCMGLVVQRSTQIKMGRKIRGKIMAYLNDHPCTVRVQNHKKEYVRVREQHNMEVLVEGLRQLEFDIFGLSELGFIAWSRPLAYIVVSGTIWVYVYKASHSIVMDQNFPCVGYFRLNSNDVLGKLGECMRGDKVWMAYNHSVRRRMHQTRLKLRLKHAGLKRKET